MKKVSEFLKELSSHDVYLEPQTAQRFKEETGYDAPWETRSVGSINCTLGQLKGIQEEIKGNESDRASAGVDISLACAFKFLPKFTTGFISGRGTLHRLAIAKLEEVGL